MRFIRDPTLILYRPCRVRKADGVGDEPAGDAGGPVARVGRHDAGRASHRARPSNLLALGRQGRHRPREERARRRPRGNGK